MALFTSIDVGRRIVYRSNILSLVARDPKSASARFFSISFYSPLSNKTKNDDAGQGSYDVWRALSLIIDEQENECQGYENSKPQHKRVCLSLSKKS